MNRREFSAAWASLGGAAALALPGLAQAQRRPEDGKDYRALDKPAAVEAAPGKIEVVEFFWYSCPHCNAFEPLLVSWIKKQAADVVVRRVPVAFRDEFVPEQRMFYALEAMGKLGTVHEKIFQAVHVPGQKTQPINREDTILAFMDKNGVDPARFKELYNSFSVSTKARKATQLQEAYQVEGVPALGIAGRFYTDGTMAGSMPRALQVADFLIAEARRAK